MSICSNSFFSLKLSRFEIQVTLWLSQGGPKTPDTKYFLLIKWYFWMRAIEAIWIISSLFNLSFLSTAPWQLLAIRLHSVFRRGEAARVQRRLIYEAKLTMVHVISWVIEWIVDVVARWSQFHLFYWTTKLLSYANFFKLFLAIGKIISSFLYCILKIFCVIN